MQGKAGKKGNEQGKAHDQCRVSGDAPRPSSIGSARSARDAVVDSEYTVTHPHKNIERPLALAAFAEYTIRACSRR